ncbi:MAG TPA: type II toxin-antitoxin system RelE/ParE family toxin [Terricaulis sp.]|nr:type II toxin-antitoxin system RelE/ParE family toxin [Terricaulis sp.]
MSADSPPPIERIAADPNIARERTEYDPPVRIYRYKAHIIIYHDLGERISIVRIRHGAEDWMNDPAETGDA